MKLKWMGRRPGILQRLMWMVGVLILILWANLGVAVYLLWQAQRDYRALADSEVPRLVVAVDLARYSADLAVLATSVLGGRVDEGGFLAETQRISRGMNEKLSQTGDRFKTAESAELDLSMKHVILQAQAQLRLSERIAVDIDTLRWLNIDIQTEIEPILRDFDYNVASRMLELRDATQVATRDLLTQSILQERRNRDLFAEIGSDAATAMTLVVQAAVADDIDRIAQIEAQLHDFTSRLAERLAEVPDAPEYLTLRQSLHRFFELIEGDEAIAATRLQWLHARTLAYEAISATLDGITSLQNRLARLSAKERDEVTARIESSADRNRRMAIALIGGTFLVIAFGALGLDRLIRNRIVVPLRLLTDELLATAEGHALSPSPPRNDEMARLSFAVKEFKRAISDRDAAIEDLRKTQKDLVQAGKMAALGTLSAGISHEINQPLGAISYRLTFLEEAIREGNLAEIDRQVQLVKALTERIRGIIQHLRRFARRGKYERQTLHFGDLVDGAVSLLGPRLREAGVTLEVEGSVAGAIVTGDPVLAEQVVLNILANAVDAIEDLGSEAPAERRRIVVSASLSEGGWTLAVSDTGIGLTSLDAETAIMPFTSSKDSSRSMGLGLSISYNIARDMQGDLSLATNDTGPGVVARFRLPSSSRDNRSDP